MNKNMKTELTKKRILAAAIQEFGSNGYPASSLNQICGKNNIPKGLLYHSFQGKDDLYLTCVEMCFADLIQYLKQAGEQLDLHQYMKARFQYFLNRPLEAHIFFEAVLQPPLELKAEIGKRKQEFDQFNQSIYRHALSKLMLRDGIQASEAILYYELLQESFNQFYSNTILQERDTTDVIADHEKKLSKLLDLMLYGIVERGNIL